MNDNYQASAKGMSRLLANFKISQKIIALVALPSIAAILFLYDVLDSRLEVLSQANKVDDLSQFVISASALVHELQKERGATAVFIGSNGEQMVSELNSQRRTTSSALNNFEEFANSFNSNPYSADFKGYLKTSQGRLRELNSKRDLVTGLNISKGAAIKYYSETIGGLIHSFECVALMTDNASMSNPVSAYVNFLSMKEYAGQERAHMAGIAASNQPITSTALINWMFVWQSQEALLREFKYLSSDDVLKFYNSKYQGRIIDEVEQIRRNLTEKSGEGNFDWSGTQVYKATTARINVLKEIEDRQVAEIQLLSENITSEAKQSLISNVILGACVFLLVIGFSIVLISGVIKPLRTVVDLVGDIADGDLTRKSEIQSKDEIGDLSNSMNTLITKLNVMITQIKDTSKLVADASNGISTASEEMAAGAEEQQAQLSEVATSIEEMSAMILETSNNSEQTQNDSSNANIAAEKGRGAVDETINGIEEISMIVQSASDQINTLKQRSQEIADVIQVIDDISDQTNLLALNANIEAARAGEAGRGFAVVADEVRKLAERTVGATADIEEKINQIQKDVSSSVTAMGKISEQSKKGQEIAGDAGSALGSIGSSIEQVNGSITQIAAAAIEQSAGVEQISKNVESVSTVSKQSATSAQDLAASAEKLNREVLGLDKLVNKFQV